MPLMKAVQVDKPNSALKLVERERPEPGPRQVRIKVEACGICHSDMMTVAGAFPGIQYPRVPGHEVIGILDAVGGEVPEWKKGMRVGVGWHGGHCGHCSRRQHHRVKVCCVALRAKCEWLECVMQMQRAAGQKPGHQRERETRK